MNTLRPVLSAFLLAVWAMGSVVLPVAHDVAHGSEQMERAERIAETHGDHHHHEAESSHGDEAQPYCPETPDVDRVCAVCSASASAMLASSEARVEAPSRQLVGADVERRAGGEGAAQSARGPPVV